MRSTDFAADVVRELDRMIADASETHVFGQLWRSLEDFGVSVSPERADVEIEIRFSAGGHGYIARVPAVPDDSTLTPSAWASIVMTVFEERLLAEDEGLPPPAECVTSFSIFD